MAAMEQNSPPETKQGAVRRGEGVIVVLQDNAAKSLTIGNMNLTAEDMLGFAEGEVKERPLAVILAPRTAEFLADEIEYTEDAPDFGEVMVRHREIRLRHRLGHEIIAQCTITRQMSVGMQACFHLVVPNDQEQFAKRKVHDFVALNLEGRMQRDAGTGLPDHATAEAFVPLLKNYLAESKLEAVFAVLRLDRHKKSLARYGKEPCVELLKHAANCCRATFRTEDIVFALSDHTLGVVLFDISRESARVVFNRLRWNIRNHRIVFGGKPDFSVTVSVVFDMIDSARGDGVLMRCETTAAGLDEEERNGLIELGA